MMTNTDLATTNGNGTALTTAETAMDLTSMQRWAKVFIESGLFKGTTNAAQRADIAKAVVKIQYGQELGLPPFASMNGIDIIDSRPAPGAGLIAALIKRDPRYNYRVIEASAIGVTLEWTEDGQTVGTTSFTVEDAERASLNKKFNWKSYPEDMCFARALTRGARRFCGDVFLGAVYVAEELEAVEQPPNFGGVHDQLPESDVSPDAEEETSESKAGTTEIIEPDRSGDQVDGDDGEESSADGDSEAESTIIDHEPAIEQPDSWSLEIERLTATGDLAEFCRAWPTLTACEDDFRRTGTIKLWAKAVVGIADSDDIVKMRKFLEGLKSTEAAIAMATISEELASQEVDDTPPTSADIAVMIRTASDATVLGPLWRVIQDTPDVDKRSRKSLSAAWAKAIAEKATPDQLSKIVGKMTSEYAEDENASAVVDLLTEASESPAVAA